MNRVWPGVVTIIFITRMTLVANLFVRPDDFAATHAWKLHALGVFSVAHLVFASKMLQYERKMQGQDMRTEELFDLLQKWLRINNVRIWLVAAAFWVVELYGDDWNIEDLKQVARIDSPDASARRVNCSSSSWTSAK